MLRTNVKTHNQILGLDFRVSDLATKTGTIPKVIFNKKWFHPQWWINRQQEKLNLIHGFVLEPAVYILGATEFARNPILVIHPKLISELKSAKDFNALAHYLHNSN